MSDAQPILAYSSQPAITHLVYQRVADGIEFTDRPRPRRELIIVAVIFCLFLAGISVAVIRAIYLIGFHGRTAPIMLILIAGWAGLIWTINAHWHARHVATSLSFRRGLLRVVRPRSLGVAARSCPIEQVRRVTAERSRWSFIPVRGALVVNLVNGEQLRVFEDLPLSELRWAAIELAFVMGRQPGEDEASSVTDAPAGG